MHSHLWCTKTLFTSFCRTDDIDSTWFTTRLYSATVPTDSSIEKTYKSCEVNRPVRLLHISSVTSFTSSVWIWFFFRAIYVQQRKRYPSLCSGPKDNEDFFHCSFMNSPLPPPPPLVPCRYQIYVHPHSTNKSMNYKRCLFARFFFITINFIIQTLLVKTTCN